MSSFFDKINSANKESKFLEVENIKFSEKFYTEKNLTLLDEFRIEFEKVGGEFFMSKTEKDTTEILKEIFRKNHWKSVFCKEERFAEYLDRKELNILTETQQLKNAEVGVNSCEFIAARTGSIIISSVQKSGRQMNIFVPHIIYIAQKKQLVKDIQQGINSFLVKNQKKNVSLISVVTGPSRTADIEKTLILGMHGPKRVLLIFENF